jgi:hypothetical protein
MSGSYVHEMNEWRWDLGADGIVRLVSEGDVETIYVGARIAARTTAKVDEHCVLLPPAVRAAVDQWTKSADAILASVARHCARTVAQETS